jgi:hypothetical protein
LAIVALLCQGANSVAAFKRTAGRLENADHVRSLFERGLQQPQGVELDLGKHVAETF